MFCCLSVQNCRKRWSKGNKEAHQMLQWLQIVSWKKESLRINQWRGLCFPFRNWIYKAKCLAQECQRLVTTQLSSKWSWNRNLSENIWPVSFTKDWNHTSLLSHDAEAFSCEIYFLTSSRNPPTSHPIPKSSRWATNLEKDVKMFYLMISMYRILAQHKKWQWLREWSQEKSKASWDKFKTS